MDGIRKLQFFVKGYRNFTKNSSKYLPLEADLTGVNYIITGANSGIGYEAAKFAAFHHAKVFLVCRSQKRGEEAVTKIKEETKNENVFLILGEMGEKEQLNRVAEEIKNRVGRVDILVHNAGCMLHTLEYNKDGLEKNYAVNTFSVYYLTKKLLPLMHPESRTIVVSSGGMYTQKLVNEDVFMTKNFDGTTQYARNKRQQICMVEQFAKREKEKGLFLSMHPGWVDTDAVRTSMPDFYESMKDKLKQPAEGADTINFLAIQPKQKLRNGQFYYDRARVSKHLMISFTTYEEKEANQMIEILEKFSEK